MQRAIFNKYLILKLYYLSIREEVKWCKVCIGGNPFFIKVLVLLVFIFTTSELSTAGVGHIKNSFEITSLNDVYSPATTNGSTKQSGLLDINAAKDLIKRVLGQEAIHFEVGALEYNEKDRFEIQSKDEKILIKGTSGVAIASGLYYYLTTFCHCQITWNGINLHLPSSLPKLKQKISKETPYKYRYYLNYCTFNYSMSWWDWPRWQKEIDWMAMHGINLPLAITGQEYTWYLVYKGMGFSDKELSTFFTGPAYFAWLWMGNIDGWGGPLPFSWMKSHYFLQKKILQRERSLGMKAVLPAFTGHVPAAFKKHFPNAKLKTTNWNKDFGNTYILDATDSNFKMLAVKFLKKQTELYGSDHLYSADTFNENQPPSNEPNYLFNLSKNVYEGMHDVDSAAIWVMQGWLFYSDREFWKSTQIKALLDAVPDDKMIILDLISEVYPVWNRTNAFFGKPWIWNMLNNFGGNTNLFGNMRQVAIGPSEALHSKNSGKMVGIGLTPEAIEQNPAIYELMTSNVWTDQPIDLKQWLPQYVLNRYGCSDQHALKAWNILENTIYHVGKENFLRDGAESIIQARPTLDSSARWVKTKLNYHPKDLVTALDELIKAIPNAKNADGFRFDLVDVLRQVMANYASDLQQNYAAAVYKDDSLLMNNYSTRFISLIEDMDQLLSTRKDFLLGPWIASARAWGENNAHKNLYEKNARDLITLWGDENSSLHEYACRQWSGLLNDFYKPRWQAYFNARINYMRRFGTEKGFDQGAFDKQIVEFEWGFVNAIKKYPTQPNERQLLTVVEKLYKKYRHYW
ncbi:alpha-N-acetylglucosaminidase [Arachidicoccus soli]|uniref:Alpha-N-acetylglucosaminidase n=1 Tax=Arachidicoccus soli TaxID=2341117 RepID=A0A386HPY1_9BACT|nr:alpha-N-acetylglucosaminidase [Arachidicoccus soli]